VLFHNISIAFVPAASETITCFMQWIARSMVESRTQVSAMFGKYNNIIINPTTVYLLIANPGIQSFCWHLDLIIFSE